MDNFIDNKYKDVTDDLERLDILEGLNLEDLEFKEDLAGTLVEKVEVGTKVVDSLQAKSHVWVEFGAGKMVQQVIQTGIMLNFTGKYPTHYREKNNQSFKKNSE